ncbi:DNA polymerase III subunit alpha [Buchnera aphidicola]|uniref:DNA polymerase III subunit alpha n=1 Tax=Buchnera aphidicola TaxID=9 RepID=UPI0031B6C6E3
MKEPKFIHLRSHSDYSMINGLAKPENLINSALKLNMPALGLTDFSNLYGTIKFYKSAYKKGIKPIIGVDFNFFSKFVEDEVCSITVLAKNETGYKNLITLASKAHQNKTFSETGPIINTDWLCKYNKGLIVLSGGCLGDIGQLILKKKEKKIKDCLIFYKTFFPNSYYLELTRINLKYENYYIDKAVEISIKNNLPIVATNPVFFIKKKDFDIHQIKVAINKGLTLNSIKKINNITDNQFMRSSEEMEKIFSDLPIALKNSVEIAKRCNIKIIFGKYFLPKFFTGNINTEDYLIKIAKIGLKKRFEKLFLEGKISKNIIPKEYKIRLFKELKVINKMGFPGYFLIVMEFIQWAKNNRIPVGPGRGSGAGSLVAYVLNITEIDPLQFNLLFERFLNLERISMPDFDIDFCMYKRDKVIEHVAEKYGKSAVSQIITFGTMTARAVIRDVGRVLGYPYGFINAISKLVPLDPGITLDVALSKQTELLDLYNHKKDVKILIDMAKHLEGVVRNVGKHAGGVVIAPTKITDFSPLCRDINSKNLLTQFDKNDIEEIGLVKFDFLGLKTLTTISLALNMINGQRSKKGKKLIEILSIPLNDFKSFKLLQNSETTAIFQLESPGMKDLIRRMHPDSFEDLIALVALFRPGPLQSGMVDNFINRKHGKEVIAYPDKKWQHKLLKPVLLSTYGIILYQEQVISIAQVFAGYTLSSADILRRAMAKKNPVEMNQQRILFKQGAKKKSINSKLSMKIFDLVEKFSGYGFNKSHSVAYALVSYQTLWLKSHYPAQFMAAAMTVDMDNTEKIVILFYECIRLKLIINAPNINISKYEFHVNSNYSIEYGLGAIKGIGKSSINEIIKERKKNGNFLSLLNICIRVTLSKLSRRIIEKLIMSGAFDCFQKSRYELICSVPEVIKSAKQYLKSKSEYQENIFGPLLTELEKVAPLSLNFKNNFSEVTKLNWEKEVLGFYLTGHPIVQYEEEINFYIRNENKISNKKYKRIKEKITVKGIVISIKILFSKNKKRFASIVIDNNLGRLEVIIFEKTLTIFEFLLKKNEILIIEGELKFSYFNKEKILIANHISNINFFRKKYVSKLIFKLNEDNDDTLFLNSLKEIFKKHSNGKVPVYMHYISRDFKKNLYFDTKCYISVSDDLLDELKEILGEKKVQLKLESNLEKILICY